MASAKKSGGEKKREISAGKGGGEREARSQGKHTVGKRKEIGKKSGEKKASKRAVAAQGGKRKGGKLRHEPNLRGG